MRNRRPDPQRRGAALIAVIVLLVAAAVLAFGLLSATGNDLAVQSLAAQRLRAEAAALSGLQLTAWQIANDEDLQQQISDAYENAQGSGEPTFIQTFQGTLGAGQYTVDVELLNSALRLHATGVFGECYADCWASLSVKPD